MGGRGVGYLKRLVPLQKNLVKGLIVNVLHLSVDEILKERDKARDCGEFQ